MRHFLVVAASSRGGRLFIKKALKAGHNITALCRAPSNDEAIARMNGLLNTAELTPGGQEIASAPGELTIRNSNILQPETYQNLLDEVPSIDAIVCFVGPTATKDMMSRKCTLYTDTVNAMLQGMQQSRSVEVFYHSSVGTEGTPHDAIVAWPKNFPFLSKFVPILFPVFKNVTRSERLLARSEIKNFKYIVFRPATLTDAKAKRHYGYSFDNSSDNQPTLPMDNAKTSISREDVAEEILRVATLPYKDRSTYHNHAVYLSDLKSAA